MVLREGKEGGEMKGKGIGNGELIEGRAGRGFKEGPEEALSAEEGLCKEVDQTLPRKGT